MSCLLPRVACRALVVNPFTSSLHTICASHTLHKMGEKLDLDVISVGGITHTIAAADISMRFD